MPTKGRPASRSGKRFTPLNGPGLYDEIMFKENEHAVRLSSREIGHRCHNYRLGSERRIQTSKECSWSVAQAVDRSANFFLLVRPPPPPPNTNLGLTESVKLFRTLRLSGSARKPTCAETRRLEANNSPQERDQMRADEPCVPRTAKKRKEARETKA